MAWGTIGAGVAILALATLWYGLQIAALGDLHARPSVRGDNKLLWAFVILCVPYVGALGYLSAGPTSFLARPRHVSGRPRQVTRTRVPVTTGRSGAGPSRVLARPVLARIESDPRRVVAGSARRPEAATNDRRPAMVTDPVIGTDSAELLAGRARTVAPLRRPATNVIRWPGAPVPPRGDIGIGPHDDASLPG